VVIYMHGNSSARLEVLPHLSYLLSLGVGVFAFDFAGSGKSDGDYVSLGYFEREDLSSVVEHLRSTNTVSTIALWGRSMGAATALMYGDRDPTIACMVLDSPFADLTQLFREMVEKIRDKGCTVPNLMLALAIRMIRGSVKKQAGFNPRDVSPISHADKTFIPALFVAGQHDTFIRPHHAEQIHEKYVGDKNLILVEGDHNSPRPKYCLDSASFFLKTCMQIDDETSLEIPVDTDLMYPPWFFQAYQMPAYLTDPSIMPLEDQQWEEHYPDADQFPLNSPGAASDQELAPDLLPATEIGDSFSVDGYADQNMSPIMRSDLAEDSYSDQNITPVIRPDPAEDGNLIGYSHEEMGMTNERQREIESSLLKMVGGKKASGNSGVLEASTKTGD